MADIVKFSFVCWQYRMGRSLSCRGRVQWPSRSFRPALNQKMGFWAWLSGSSWNIRSWEEETISMGIRPRSICFHTMYRLFQRSCEYSIFLWPGSLICSHTVNILASAPLSCRGTTLFQYVPYRYSAAFRPGVACWCLRPLFLENHRRITGRDYHEIQSLNRVLGSTVLLDSATLLGRRSYQRFPQTQRSETLAAPIWAHNDFLHHAWLLGVSRRIFSLFITILYTAKQKLTPVSASSGTRIYSLMLKDQLISSPTPSCASLPALSSPATSKFFSLSPDLA